METKTLGVRGLIIKPGRLAALVTWAALGACGDQSPERLASGQAAAGSGTTVRGALTSPPTIAEPALLTTEAVGSLANGGAVTDAGAYTHRIPIDVLPGRAGMQPNLALNYHSRGGNGVVGMGWSITGGASYITRCTRIYGAGRQNDHVRFDTTDRFCLDGEGLLVTSGTYGALNSEYRTEIDSFAKIVLTGLQTTPGFIPEPTEFTVYYKDGRIGTFTRQSTLLTRGLRTADGAIGHSDVFAMMWPIAKLRDRAGNGIRYTYTPSAAADATPLPSRIEYTTCETSPCAYPSARLRRVDFGYEDRAARDQIENWVSGARMLTTKRLVSVTTSMFNASTSTYERVLKYALTYVQGAVSGRTLLKDVKLCDSGSPEVCTPKTTFAWQGESNVNWQTEGTGTNGLRFRFAQLDPLDRKFEFEPENTIAVFDANGDGNDDVLLKEWPNLKLDPNDQTLVARDWIWLGDGNHYVSATPAEIDPDGDGVRKSGCTGAEVMDFGSAQPVDLDGDGRVELLVAENDTCPFADVGGVKRRIQPGGSAGISPATEANHNYRVLAWDPAKSTLTRVEMPPQPGPGIQSIDMQSWAMEDVHMADIDGDGLPELFRGSQQLGRWQVMVAGRFSQTPAMLPQVAYFSMLEVPMLVEPSNINPTFRPQTFQVFDEDNDGRADLIQTDYKSGRRGFSYAADFATVKFRYRKTAGAQAFTEQSTSSVAAAAPTWPVARFDDGPDGSPEGKQGYWHAVDINGDGLKDAIYTTDFAANTPWEIRINTGNGYLPPASPGPVAATLQTYPKDTALVTRVCNVSCPPAQRKGLDNGLRIADMNGDGREDLVLLDPLPESTPPTLDPSNYHASTSPIRIAYSNGTGFDAPVALPSHGFGRLWRRQETSGMTQLGDIDGDGLPEVIDLVKDNSVGVARRLLVQYRTMPAGGIDVVYRVEDERGGAEFIEYDNLSAGSAKRLNKNATDTHVTDLNKPNPVATCKYPARCVSKGVAVRSYINDRQPKHVENLYSYMGARSDVTGRGWLGFAQVTRADRVTNFLRSDRYNQTALESAIVDKGNGAGFTLYPKLGEPSNVSEFYDSGGSPAADLAVPTARPYSVTSTTLTHTGYPLRLTDRSSSTLVYENTTSVTNLRRAYTSRGSYDEFGCPLNDSSTNVVIGSGASSYATANMYSYRNDPSTWLIGLMDRRDETTSTKDDAYGTGCVGTDTAPCATTTLTTEYDFDSRGLTISEAIDPHFNTGIHPLQRVFHRDGAGLITSTDESDMNDVVPILRTSSSVYDESGVNVKEIANPAGHKTWFQHHPRTSWLYAQADQNGPADKVDLLIKHDRLGRVRELSEDDGRVVTINYGAGVERRAVADGQSTATFVDPNGRVILETWSTFDGKSAVRESQYNSLGAVTKQRYNASTQSHAALSGSEQTARMALGSAPTQLSAASFDALGRPMSATKGQNETTLFSYPTPLGTTSITDGNGNVRDVFTDGNGNVRSLKQRVPGTTPRDVVTKYAYQERGLLSLVRTADNARDVLKYDSLGRLLERRSFTASGTSNILNLGRAYSAFGEPLFEYHGGTGSGVTSVQYTRDKLGRVTERKDVTPGTAGEVDTFTWDPSNGIGRLFESKSSAENGNYAHTSRFHYDSLGRVDERREIFGGTLGSETFTFGYTYDGRGRPDTVRYPETGTADVFGHPRGGGLTLKYGYKNGQLDFIRDTSKPATDPPVWQAQSRDVFGFVATAKNAANVLSTWQRDPRTLRLGSLVVTSGTTTLVSQGFSYYSNGQLQAHLNGNLDERYTYDALNRLKTYDRTNSAQASQNRISAAFTYDDVGNMTLLDTVTSTGSPDWPAQDETFGFSGTLPNYLQSQTINGAQTTFIPDNMGRVQQHMNSSTGQILRTYAYTTFDLPRTIALSPQSKLAKFEYTGQGERSRKVTTTTGAATVDVAYVGSLYEQRRNINGAQVTGESVFRIPGETGMIAEITQAWTSSALGARSTRFIHNDHQGSPIASTAGSTVTAAGFLPFGKKAGTPPSLPPAASLGYTGHIQDDDLGLINMKGRVYDVGMHRFISRDSQVDDPLHAGGFNPYSYVLNDPLNRVDPTGRSSSLGLPGGGPPPGGGGGPPPGTIMGPPPGGGQPSGSIGIGSTSGSQGGGWGYGAPTVIHADNLGGDTAEVVVTVNRGAANYRANQAGQGAGADAASAGRAAEARAQHDGSRAASLAGMIQSLLHSKVGADDDDEPEEPVTLDPQTERQIGTLDPRLQPLARDYLMKLREAGVDARIMSGGRTWEEQDKLYAQGRTAPGNIVTKVQAGDSAHNYGAAFDIGIFDQGKYQGASPMYRAAGLSGLAPSGLFWGALLPKFVDMPHYQMCCYDWRSTPSLQPYHKP